MDNERLELARYFDFANKTLNISYTKIVEAYNQEHGTTWSRGWVSRLLTDLARHRAQHKIISFPGGTYQDELPRYDHPPHVYIDSPTDVAFVAHDWHSPLIHSPFANAQIQHMKWHKRRGNSVSYVFGGDIQDNGTLSRHPKTALQMSIHRQKRMTQAYLTELTEVADMIYLMRGNHDDWLARLLDGKLDANDYSDWLLSGLKSDKIKFIDSTKCVVHNCGTDWRITHSIQYSTIAGRNANRLANKFDMNVITGHEHSLAILRDDNNRHTVIANGMMADFALMSYVHDYDTKHNVMKNSYVVLQDGKFEVMTPYPEWQDWKRYDVDPLPMYEYENQKQQVLTGKLDLMRWLESEAA